jgi:putative inorganic carbon (HCO3(-)) transporter
VIRAGRTRNLTVRTPFDLPILCLVALLPFNLAISPDWSLTLPKIYGIVFGAIFFHAILNHISTPRDLSRAIFWLVLLALAIAVAGLIGTDWAQTKIISASFIYDRLPRFIQGIPRSIAGGFARNGIGGTLTFTIPLLAAMAYAVIASPGGATQHLHRAPSRVQMSFGRRLRDWFVAPNALRNDTFGKWLPAILLAALLFSLLTLALTQSRGGILGVSVGLLALIGWKRPRIGLSILAVGSLTLVVLVLLGSGGVIAIFLSDGTLASRMEVWQRGWMMVQDFPFTGIGIGTYNVVAHALYPFFIAGPDEIVPHAHNQFLEVAVGLGIPGLILYLALLAIFFICAARAYRAVGDAGVRAFIAGLMCGMIAHHVFGLTDAFILGTKPGLLMWIYFALIAACYSQTSPNSPQVTQGQRRKKGAGLPMGTHHGLLALPFDSTTQSFCIVAPAPHSVRGSASEGQARAGS